MNVDPQTSKERPVRRSKFTLQRRRSYVALGFVLVAGLIAVVAFVAGMPSLGYVPASTSVAMASIAIAMLAIASIIMLTTLRPTLSKQETATADQAREQAHGSARIRAKYRLGQWMRDRQPAVEIAAPSVSREASSVHKQTEAERRRVRIGPRNARRGPHPFDGGVIHPVRGVEGIGDHYGARLDSLGITDTKRLWSADSSHVARALKLTPGHVENWQCMAELMSVNGIEKQYAELLVSAGVPSIRALCAETPQTLLDRIIRLERRQGNRVQGKTIGIKAVETWIQAAQPRSSGGRARAVAPLPKRGE